MGVHSNNFSNLSNLKVILKFKIKTMKLFGGNIYQ